MKSSGCLPPMRQMWYCVCDINLPVAQKILRRDFFATLKEYSEVNGWLPGDKIDTIRDAIKQDVRQTAQKIRWEENEEDDVDYDSEDEDQDTEERNVDSDDFVDCNDLGP